MKPQRHALKFCHRSFANLLCCRKQLSSTTAVQPKVCIVGSGPAGFYTAQQILKGNPAATVDIYERLPLPFGLVRFGVAPDHPEVKNVISTFTNTGQNARCSFIGNVNVGVDVTIEQLCAAYNAIVLSYGAEDDRVLGIQGESLDGVISARSFVGWYNGLPCDTHLNPNLDVETAVILGQGNVALDVARILLLPLDMLAKTDITDYAFEALSRSKIRKVYLIGRRGPLQVAFTIKELREMITMPGCQCILHRKDFEGISSIVSGLPRPRKRLTELMLKTAMGELSCKEKEQLSPVTKECEFMFLHSPSRLLPFIDKKIVGGVELVSNKLEGEYENAKAVATDQIEKIDCGLVLRSIGYKSIPIDPTIPFDMQKGIIPNKGGRVIGHLGLYCSGWVATGPVGVIQSTMSSGINTGKMVAADLQGDIGKIVKPGKEVVLSLLKQKGKKLNV